VLNDWYVKSVKKDLENLWGQHAEIVCEVEKFMVETNHGKMQSTSDGLEALLRGPCAKMREVLEVLEGRTRTEGEWLKEKESLEATESKFNHDRLCDNILALWRNYRQLVFGIEEVRLELANKSPSAADDLGGILYEPGDNIRVILKELAAAHQVRLDETPEEDGFSAGEIAGKEWACKGARIGELRSLEYFYSGPGGVGYDDIMTLEFMKDAIGKDKIEKRKFVQGFGVGAVNEWRALTANANIVATDEPF
jgi:hypothetical protein